MGFLKGPLHSVKGMRDLYADSLLKHQLILKTSQKILNKFGFSPVMLNILEHEEVFKRTLGEESEIITKEMYSFKDLSDNVLVLRPEGTAGMMRMVLETNKRYQVPLKLYYDGPMFRYERPQKGRLRQFYQIGAEHLGTNDDFADVEMMMIAYQIMKNLKPQTSFKIEINSLGNAQERKEYNKALLEYLSIKENFEKLSELSKLRIERKNPLRVLDSKENNDIEIVEKSPKIGSFLGNESSSRFQLIKKALKDMQIPIFENPCLVRGLDYYCHTCFELKEDDPLSDTKAQSTLIGGGRYDFLANYLSGSKQEDALIPATGFAAGIDRIANLLDDVDLEKFSKENRKIKVGLVPVISKRCPEEKKLRIKLKLYEVMKMFENGFEFEFLVGEKKTNQQFEFLEKRKFDFAFIVGESELDNEKLQVKELSKREAHTFDFKDFNKENFLKHYEIDFI